MLIYCVGVFPGGHTYVLYIILWSIGLTRSLSQRYNMYPSWYASSQEIRREPSGTFMLAVRDYAIYFGLGSDDFVYKWAHERQNSLQNCATEF